MHAVHRCGLLLQMSPVACLSVCLCVGHTDVLCKNGWTDRDAVLRVTSCWSNEPLLDGVKIGRIHSQTRWIQFGDAVYAAFCQITLDTCWLFFSISIRNSAICMLSKQITPITSRLIAVYIIYFLFLFFTSLPNLTKKIRKIRKKR